MRKYHIDLNKFNKIKDPQIAYALGFIWADGYIQDKDNCHSIAVEILSDDAQKVFPIIHYAGAWGVYHRNRVGRKPQSSTMIQSKELVSLLLKNDYGAKSHASADKILATIPSNLRYYWFRGLIDGDGCFYFNKKTGQAQFGLTSSYHQDWRFVENLLQNLGIKYSIQKIKRDCGEHSTIRISNGGSVLKLGAYLYPSLLFDGIGLTRKYDKLIEIKSHKLRQFQDLQTLSHSKLSE